MSSRAESIDKFRDIFLLDQTAFFMPLIRTGARRNPATCGTNQGN